MLETVWFYMCAHIAHIHTYFGICIYMRLWCNPGLCTHAYVFRYIHIHAVMMQSGTVHTYIRISVYTYTCGYDAIRDCARIHTYFGTYTRLGLRTHTYFKIYTYTHALTMWSGTPPCCASCRSHSSASSSSSSASYMCVHVMCAYVCVCTRLRKHIVLLDVIVCPLLCVSYCLCHCSLSSES